MFGKCISLLMADVLEETTKASEETTSGKDIIEAAGSAVTSTVEEANKLLETIEGYIPKIINFGIKLLIALVIFGVGKIIISFVLKFVKRIFGRSKIDVSVSKFLMSLSKAVLYLILIIIVCAQVGIDTTSFIAVLGSAGLALGLALQGSLSNFAGGVLILLLRPFSVGDYVVDEGTGKEGTVEKIDLFYTHLASADNKKIIIPNGNLTNSAITNVTAQDKRRVDIEVGISYNANMAEAKKVLEKLIMKDERVLKNENIQVVVKELAASQVTILMRAWTKTENYWSVFFDLTEGAKNALDEAGIEIPFNQLDVHITNN